MQVKATLLHVMTRHEKGSRLFQGAGAKLQDLHGFDAKTVIPGIRLARRCTVLLEHRYVCFTPHRIDASTLHSLSSTRDWNRIV